MPGEKPGWAPRPSPAVAVDSLRDNSLSYCAGLLGSGGRGGVLDLTTASVGAALEPVSTMLEADGYGLVVDVLPQGLHVTITAGPEACKECLVPKPVLEGVLRHTLQKAGIALGPSTI